VLDFISRLVKLELHSAKLQHDYALILGNNASAWEAVLERFPDDPVWAPSARKNLASLYLQRNDLDNALPLYRE
jgi:hypothetical protein